MFRMIRAFLPGMIEKGGGSIINMSSVAGVPMGVANRFVYSATRRRSWVSLNLWRPISSAKASAATPLRRARSVYLGSDISAYTTGHVHVIDGGTSL